ncbi:hypothetical protein B0H19DRAFT_1066048 [Mycena capillaripes]|nr:hypothetical protein B0H19DRAFT_1066048 [Mycena capillaripes]
MMELSQPKKYNCSKCVCVHPLKRRFLWYFPQPDHRPGTYVVLFGFYLHILQTKERSNNRFLHAAMIALFLLCTMHCGLLIASTVIWNKNAEGIPRTLKTAADIDGAANGIYVASSLLADTIFTYRCCAIWKSHRIVILPIVLTVLTGSEEFSQFRSADANYPLIPVAGFSNIVLYALIVSVRDYSLEYTSSIMMELSIAISVFTNFVLMGLTASRIWWLGHKARERLGRKSGRYYTLCAMILESGAIYCFGGLIFLILTFRCPVVLGGGTGVMVGAMLGQLVGIAPTVLAVRIVLGNSVEGVHSFVVAPRPRSGAPLGLQPATVSAALVEQRTLDLRPEGEKTFKT